MAPENMQIYVILGMVNYLNIQIRYSWLNTYLRYR